MSGPYAHITLLYEIVRSAGTGPLFPPDSQLPDIVRRYFSYCALGAVSPDYPNLARETEAVRWADAMHCSGAGEMILCGMAVVAAHTGEKRDKLLSWLLGYAAHVATDATIHPVVQAKVGVYAENQRQHRICEMNQDSYIFNRMDWGEIGESDRFARQVTACCAPGDHRHLDRDVAGLWSGMLTAVHPQQSTESPPDPDAWHRAFVTRADRSAAGTSRLFPLAENIADTMGLAYPPSAAVDRQYVEELEVPLARPLYLHYDRIFDRAVANVVDLWKVMERGVSGGGDCSGRIANWHLDTGLDEHGRLAFWE
ncbi:zinc dependent phospholipase C family protein [Geobacter sp. SVR]|uniref:zinc dependent phospholipase C family protein n=1 Tax=Geobacter sp. SVR TaxID=2495594 RepID=UPI00143EFEAC|nr:zinc dependent phospholipase C family protein [Geobacter sp. SVR]BCS53374.1 hypothetical protein GSVR_16820 [Geobacter sp. SVR]GCF85500.1 hypothetical protein GSbR_21000 [Geobacter sp. SVR]